MKAFFTLFLCGVFSFWALAEHPAPKLVFLGDSLTSGYTLPEEVAFPALIQSFLDRDGLSWKIVNAGVSGDTTAGGLGRLDWILRGNPQMIFIALGSNDGLRGLPIHHIKKNLENIVRKLKRAGVPMVLAGCLVPSNYGEVYSARFKNLFSGIAQKYDLPFFPFLLEDVAGHPELNLPDGMHPNPTGHKKIAHHVYHYLKPLLNKAALNAPA